ncbi:MAG: hypothetical protein IIU75_05420, partial [Rikenellaceae bacterium]|nr:hypothetical protein [Rikenellaceae bacterium]
MQIDNFPQNFDYFCMLIVIFRVENNTANNIKKTINSYEKTFLNAGSRAWFGHSAGTERPD